MTFREFLSGAVSRSEASAHSSGDNFVVPSAGPLTYEEAQALYRSLAKFFAAKGAEEAGADEMGRRGQKGSARRWGTSKPPE
jgi:hypothetical protein